MEEGFWDRWKGKEVRSDDGRLLLNIYSDVLRSEVADNIPSLFPDVLDFFPLAELASGDVIGLQGGKLVIVLHDSGEVMISAVNLDEFILLIEARNPELEDRVFGEG